MIFVDTGAWFAYAIPDDEHYQAARQWVRQNRIPLITTDYIIDETLTLLKARGQADRAIQIGELLFSGQLSQVHYLSGDNILAAWQVFAYTLTRHGALPIAPARLLWKSLASVRRCRLISIFGSLALWLCCHSRIGIWKGRINYGTD